MPNLSRARDRCRWPHQLPTAESERELTAVIERVRPFIIDAATIISRHDASLALELEQQALSLVWQLWSRGPEHLAEGDGYVRGAIVRHMKAVRRGERRALGGK